MSSSVKRDGSIQNKIDLHISVELYIVDTFLMVIYVYIFINIQHVQYAYMIYYYKEYSIAGMKKVKIFIYNHSIFGNKIVFF